MTTVRDERRLLVLYGSQTGTAQDLSAHLARAAFRLGLHPVVCSMDEYDRSFLIHEKAAIFICSTTGQGDEPDNMKKFWKFLLRKDIPLYALGCLAFSVFGLGDSSYARYNYVAKKLFRRLSQLNAQALLKLGLGDDQHALGVDAVFDEWLDLLLLALANHYKIDPNGVIEKDLLLPSRFTISWNATTHSETLETQNGQYDRNNPFKARVNVNNRISSMDHFQDIRHISFDLKGSNIQYQSGDILYVLPQNVPDDVHACLSRLDLLEMADQPFFLVPNETYTHPPHRWKYPLTFRQLFTCYLDINHIPHRSLFEFLYHFTDDPLQHQRLKEFSSAEGQQDLIDYCRRTRRTAMEVLQDFSHVKIPPNYLFDIFPELQARPFSISSCLNVHPNTATITVGLVSYQTSLRKPRIGICSKYLSNLNVNDVVQLWTCGGTFRLPAPSIPVILIGPGTGIAPMRSIIEYRISQNSTENYLFVGCRYKEKDFIYAEEWQKYENAGALHLFTAFSREDNVYVQQRLYDNKECLFELITKRQAVIFVSGNAKKMPTDVKNMFKTIIVEEGHMTMEEADVYITDMEKEGRYQSETWY